MLKLGSLLKTWSNITEEFSVTQVNSLDHVFWFLLARALYTTEDGSIHYALIDFHKTKSQNVFSSVSKCMKSCGHLKKMNSLNVE